MFRYEGEPRCIFCDRAWVRLAHCGPPTNFFDGDFEMVTLIAVPMFAAAGYSAMYLLGGGGIFGAIVIFFVAKAMGK
jgi:hypothetical protein